MDSIWLDGLNMLGHRRYDISTLARNNRVRSAQANNAAVAHGEGCKELTHHVERLSLLNQALWEILRERMALTDEELNAQALAVDLRDGVQDGRITTRALTCPACSRVSSSKHYRCLYCSQLFERPLFG